MNDQQFLELKNTIERLVRSSNVYAWRRHSACINEATAREYAEEAIKFEKELLDIADKLADLSSHVNPITITKLMDGTAP